MSFISIEFLIFYVIVFTVYYAFPKLCIQNFLIVVASYVFYGWWDWRFLPLLIGISIVNYITALMISGTPSPTARRALLTLAITVAILALAVFKYFNFFIESFNGILRAAGLTLHPSTMKIMVADSMAPIVDSLFVKDQPFGWSVVLGTIAFGIQIYADFCGYSLIAKGVALVFGFELIWNFRFPYWATSMSEFWRRWHISL